MRAAYLDDGCFCMLVEFKGQPSLVEITNDNVMPVDVEKEGGE